MRRGLGVALLSACLFGIIVESAVIRIWRDKALRAKLKLREPQGGDGEQTTPPTSGQPTAKLKRKGFRPTHSRCCKIGEKVAKRKLSCDVQILEVIRQLNDMQRAKLKYNRPRKVINSKISAKLSNKLRKCSASFPKYFEKCCKYREQFYNSIARCKLRQGKERRKCRQSVRRLYKSPSSQNEKQRKPRRRNSQQQPSDLRKRKKGSGSRFHRDGVE